jgi:S-adenosylmethionine decarboxylase
MQRLNDPVTHCSDKYGWAGWVHWEASGAHLYAWEDPILFFSVDIYTCAEFDKQKVTEFTSAFFAAEEVVAKGF